MSANKIRHIDASPKLILGIDPGTQHTGYAIVGEKGSRIIRVCSGSWPLHNYATDEKKLHILQQNIEKLLAEHPCQALAFEDAFYGKNAQSMLKLGRVQGVLMCTAYAHQLSVAKYAPNSLKKVVTGQGRASKEWVARHVWLLVGEPQQETGTRLDESDALAAAICHLLRQKL